LKDGWSVGGVRTALPDQQIFVYDLPNGAHHSDLAHSEPGPQDTEDVQAAHKNFAALLTAWLNELKQ
jgi:lysosomal Pro-X carboxypeptidase